MKLREFAELYTGSDTQKLLIDPSTDDYLRFDLKEPISKDYTIYMTLEREPYYIWCDWLRDNLEILAFSESKININLYDTFSKQEYIDYARNVLYTSRNPLTSDDALVELIICDVQTNSGLKSDLVSQKLLDMVNLVSKVEVKGED